MSAAAPIGNFSTSSQIKALGLTATDTRKALRILALSESLVSLVTSKPEEQAEAQPTTGVMTVPTIQ